MYENELKLALKLADTTGPLILSHFRQQISFDAKADTTPVTIADRCAEKKMRDLIAAQFPNHGVIGEEFGPTNPDAEFVWVLDPIDGTKSFITGSPLFGTLIALLKDGKPVIGLIEMPALKERWVGCEGQPTTFNGTPVRTRSCEDISTAWLYSTSPQMFKGDDFPAFERVRKQTWCTLYGADCYSYGLLANGSCDLIVEAQMGPHDFCALIPVITGAGGVVCDWQGNPLGLHSDGRVLAAGDATLAEAARKLLE